MTDSSAAGLCRLTVRTPERVVDLAVPASVPIADLLPTLVTYGGEGLEESGLDHGGWVLQKLGGAPLDEEGTAQSLELRDGEVLYLRPRADRLPEVHFDDLVDGIATTLRATGQAWNERYTRITLRAVMVAVLAAGLLALALPGGDRQLRAGLAAAAGVLVLAGAASASRAVGDAAAGAALGVMAAPYLALAGALLPTAASGSGAAAPGELLGAQLLAGSAAGAGGAVLAVAAVAAYVPLLTSSAVVALAGVAWGSLMLLMDIPASHAASLTAVLAVVFGAMVPALSARLAGLRLPALPTNADELQEGIDPHDNELVVTRSALAEEWMTALFGAAGLVCGGCLAGLLLDRPGLPALITAGVLALVLLLHARGIGAAPSRIAVLLPGVGGLLFLAFATSARISPGLRPALVAVLLAVAAMAAIASWTVPGRRMVPYWGRAADLLHSIAAVALLPLALWVLGAFGALRAIGS
ncbi:type VII secretion integral membrane protein EccD [Streptomyces sp. NPDC060031]|uniref:type VII secretion integral membrane protein EccD n=1 Tax=Streptomyces sp. NPDC060031 TaxID=3347043 RepID=UPI00367E2883